MWTPVYDATIDKWLAEKQEKDGHGSEILPFSDYHTAKGYCDEKNERSEVAWDMDTA
jgi:hypothetical protein